MRADLTDTKAVAERKQEEAVRNVRSLDRLVRALLIRSSDDDGIRWEEMIR